MVFIISFFFLNVPCPKQNKSVFSPHTPGSIESINCLDCMGPQVGELHNWFNLISEERVKFFKHNSKNLMKIGWKIRKLWHFEVSQILTKHFLTSRYEYMQMSELMMSSPHYLPYISYIKFWKFQYLPKLVIVCPSYQDILELTLFCIY